MAQTFFASPERAAPALIARQQRAVISNPVLELVLQAVGGYVCVINGCRQILEASRELFWRLGLSGVEELEGRRLGELLRCANAESAPSGCGTSKRCSVCGALAATLAALEQGETSTEECSLRMRFPEGWETREFRVRASPLPIESHQLAILILHDISSEKRRLILERTFIHDLRNTMAGLLGWSELLVISDSGEIPRRIVQIATLLNREVESHHLLYQAEQDQLRLQKRWLSVTTFLNSIQAAAALSELTDVVTLQFELPEPDLQIWTDEAVLSRVVLNMVKNAVEATPSGGRVRLWTEVTAGQVVFRVHNPGCIPPEAQLKIFQRSFTTKGTPGRGLGTYSMKLFGERYLQGVVDFRSTSQAGTTFSMTLPAEALEGEGRRGDPVQGDLPPA